MPSLFSSPKAPPPIPTPPLMPTPDNSAVAKAKQDQMQAASARTGRAATILSQGDASQQRTNDQNTATTLGGNGS